MEAYHSDPYKADFSAVVRSAAGPVDSASGVFIELEPNYFFPGGGGQACDKGEISWSSGKAKVIEVVEEGGKVKLRVEFSGASGSPLKQGDAVQCRVDWLRRYPLMKAHTSEHMLFQALSRQFPGIKPEKVYLEPGACTLFVSSQAPLAWGKVLEAEKLVNKIIQEGHAVSVHAVKKADVGVDVRIKLERLGGEEEIHVVDVEGFDKAACSGLHVQNTKEIGFFCVNRIASDKPGVWKLEFLVGDEALAFLLSSSACALSSAQALGTGMDRLEKTVLNLKENEVQARVAIKELAELAFAGLPVCEKNGLRVYKKIFSAMGTKVLQEWASKLTRNEKTLVIFAVNGDDAGAGGTGNAFLLLGKSKDLQQIDMRKIGGDAFKLMNGKGGGNEFFVNGSGDPKKLDAAIAFVMQQLPTA